MLTPGAIRDQLDERAHAAFTRLCADAPPLPSGFAPLHLPIALRESLVGAAILDGGVCPEPLAAWYCERMPQLCVEQLYANRDGDPVRALLWRRIDLERAPRLRASLDGAFAALARVDLDPARLFGAPSTAALLAARPTVAALFRGALFGAGMPMVGAYPHDRVSIRDELDRGGDVDEVLDRRLGNNVAHELLHGLPRSLEGPPPPWMLVESAAIHLGATASLGHAFPDAPGEAVAGVSLFVLVGAGLAAILGERALWSSLVEPERLRAILPARTAAALEVAAWQDHLARGEPPFARDALDAPAWIKLVDATLAARLPPFLDGIDAADPLALAPRVPDLRREADALPWRALPWYEAAATERDEAMARMGVAALFQANVLAPSYQTHPSEPPGGALALDVATGMLAARARENGVFGEPARWVWPAPWLRSLASRGCHRVTIVGARRALCGAIADALVELSTGTRALDGEVELGWTSTG